MALREVILIVGMAAILLMLLLLWLGRTQGDSSRIICERRQQQTAAAMMQYEVLHGHYPGYKNLQSENADGERQPTGWVFGLLPFLDSQTREWEEMTASELRELAQDSQAERPYEGLFEDHGPTGEATTRGTPVQQRILELICPDDPVKRDPATENPLCWVVNTGLPDAAEYGEFPADWTANGMFENQFDPGAALPPRLTADWLSNHDGLATTLMLTENADAGAWTDFEEAQVDFVWVAELENGFPSRGGRLLAINEQVGAGDGQLRFARPASYHVGGVNAVYASGRTQFLSADIDYLVFTQLLTSDGENARLPGSETPVPQVYR